MLPFLIYLTTLRGSLVNFEQFNLAQEGSSHSYKKEREKCRALVVRNCIIALLELHYCSANANHTDDVNCSLIDLFDSFSSHLSWRYRGGPPRESMGDFMVD
jgi:hypothetical protein